MGKGYLWKENLVTALEIPRDLGMKETIITVTGKNMAVIENYKNILRYTKEEIVVMTYRGKLCIYGKRLWIPCYTADEMKIKGNIEQIILEQ